MVLTELTDEENALYEQAAIDLQAKYKVTKVNPVVLINPDTNERVVAYLKEPSFSQKLYAMDKIASVGVFIAGEELRSALTLKDDSDFLTYGDTPECDQYKLGIVTFCVTLIKGVQNSFKKK